MPTGSPEPINAFDAWMVENQEVIFGGFIALMGLATLTMGVVSISEGRRGLVIMRESKHWPTVPGEITESRVSHRMSTVNGVLTNYYEPIIKYTYRVNEQQYDSTRVLATSFMESVDRGGAHAWVERYAVGQPVVVFYNPQRPAEALLETANNSSGRAAREKIGCGLSAFLFGVGCFAALYFLLTRGG